MVNPRYFALALFALLAAVWADSYSASFSSSSYSVSTNVVSDFSVSTNTTTYCMGSTIQLTASLPITWGSSSFSATSYSATNAVPVTSGYESGGTAANLVSSSAYNSYMWYYTNCMYGSNGFRCANSRTEINQCSQNGYWDQNAFDACNWDPLGGSGSPRPVYYVPIAQTGRGYAGMFCSGSMSINGNNVGEITGSHTASITLPNAPGTYSVPLASTYNCFFAVKQYYYLGQTTDSQITTLYDSFSHTTNYNYDINVVNCCSDSASISVSGPASIMLNGTNQASVTLTVTNTGNVPVTINSVSVSQGSFSTAGVPVTINPGYSASISGTFTGSAGSVTFTVSGNATVCGVLRTVNGTFTTTANAVCLVDVLFVGVSPVPITLSNGSADITATIYNSGNVDIYVDSFAASPGFTFTTDDSLPFLLTVGQTYGFNGTLDYSGGTQPQNVTITVYVGTTDPTCTNTTSASDDIFTTITEGVDLGLTITPNDTFMAQNETGYANVTVTNVGTTDIFAQSKLDIAIVHCADNLLVNCQETNPPWQSYTVPALLMGQSYVRATDDYDCMGSAYIGIMTNLTSGANDTNPVNNYAVEVIPCSHENCSIDGPLVLDFPGTYNFTAVCYDSTGAVADCEAMVDGSFSWTYVDDALAIVDYGTVGYGGLAQQNMFLEILGLTGNGTMSVSANGFVQVSGNKINCTANFPIIENLCAKQI